MGQEQVRTAFSGCAVGHFTHWNVSRPNKQNPDSGIETFPQLGGQASHPGPNKQNPDSGIETQMLYVELDGGISPNKQNPDSGIETARYRNRLAHENGPNKQNPDSGIETRMPEWARWTLAVQTNRIPTQGLKRTLWR